MDKAVASGPRPSAGALDCHICFEAPMDAVATSCGHVFCWPCIYPFFQNERKRKACPVCDSTLATINNSILPIFGGETSSSHDAAAHADEPALPPRPRNPRKFVPRVDGFDPELADSAAALRHVQDKLACQRAQNDREALQMEEELANSISVGVEELLAQNEELVQDERVMLPRVARLERRLARALAQLPDGQFQLDLPFEEEEPADDDDLESEDDDADSAIDDVGLDTQSTLDS